MKEFIDKLISRLEEYKIKRSDDSPYGIGVLNGYAEAISIVNELAEEYKGGWIAVSERLPNKEEYLKNDGRFIVTDGNRCYQSVFDIYSKVFRTSVFTTFGNYRYEEDKCVIAWMPLTAPFKEGE